MSMPSITQRVFDCNGYRYEIREAQVDHSDYDALYLAWRKPLSSDERSSVVMKWFPTPSDENGRQRLWEEVQIATYLEHANISKVHGVATSPDRTAYVVSEFMAGLYLLTALDFALLLGRRFSPAFCAYVAAMVAHGLDCAHKREDREGHNLNIIHRAVSPMCVRLAFDGRVKLGNFGSAYSQLRDRLQTAPGLLRGDAAYTAPEIWRALMASPGPRFDSIGLGLVDGRADVFSLGLVLLEMLLGEYPLDPADTLTPHKPIDLVAKVSTERSTWIEPEVLAERILRFDAAAVEERSKLLPKGLKGIVRRALHPEPSERCDAGAMRDGLLGYLKGLERPFAEEEASKELKTIFDAAKGARRLLANPIERTALSPGND